MFCSKIILCWVIRWSAATPGWCSQEGPGVPGWCHGRELNSAVVVGGPGKQDGAGGMRGEVFSRMDALGFYQGNGTLHICPGEGNETVRDGWESSDLTEFRNMCALILRCTVVPGAQRGYLQEKSHILQFLQGLVWLVLQPLQPTPSSQETEEEKQFRALFEQISGKVSTKPFGSEQDAKRGERLLLLSRATWNKPDIFWEYT